MKKIFLILGVGNAQVDLIKRCKEYGYEVFGISYKEEGRGLEYIDHFKQINIIDKKEVLKYAQSISADVVYSVGSDIAMPTVGYVSERLGTPFFVDEKTAELLHYKGRLRQFLIEKHINPIAFKVASSLEEFSDWNIFPAIIKPVDSQGQRGVFEVHKPADLQKHFTKSQSFSRSRNVIVEQYIDGPEFSVNTFVQNGLIVYSFMTDRYVIKEKLPCGIIKGHGIPAKVDDWVREKTASLLQEVINALGIRNGPVYFQLKYTDVDVFIIEITPRLDGCHLWRFIKLMYGIDLLDLTIRQLERNSSPPQLDTNPTKPVQKQNLYLDFFHQKTGTQFQKVKSEKESCLYEEWYYKEGETVRYINGYLEKTGYQIWAE